MRNIIVGIIIGCVIGIVLGVTILSQKLHTAVPGQAVVSQRDLEKASEPEELRIPNLFDGDTITWRTSAAFPATLPTVNQQARALSRQLATLSADKIILPTAIADSPQNAEQLFAAIASGQIDALVSTADIAVDKEPALWLFSALPFSPDPSVRLAWMTSQGARKILKDSFNNHNIEPLVCGFLPARGLWLDTPLVNTDQYSDLRLYATGLAARVWSKLGATLIDVRADEILASFDADNLDGALFDSPEADLKAGFAQFAQNYYLPGWLNNGQPLLLLLNSRIWNRLSEEHRALLRASCLRQSFNALAAHPERQLSALADLSRQGVRVSRYPTFVTASLNEAWQEVLAEEIRRNKTFLSAWEDMQAFLKIRDAWKEMKDNDPAAEILR